MDQMAVCSAPWPLAQWTTAPLRLEKVATFDVQPSIIFVSLTQPEEMCRLFSWMHKVTVDNSAEPHRYGLGAKRYCHFGNGMVLEEVIVGWEPPLRYAYRGIDENHPFGMIGHLGIIECVSLGEQTRLIWQHYFDHPNPSAMCKQLEISTQQGLDSLKDRFNS